MSGFLLSSASCGACLPFRRVWLRLVTSRGSPYDAAQGQASYVAGFPVPDRLRPTRSMLRRGVPRGGDTRVPIPRARGLTRLADRTSGLVELALRFRTANSSLDHSNGICRTSILQQKLTPSTVAVLQEFETAAQRTSA